MLFFCYTVYIMENTLLNQKNYLNKNLKAAYTLFKQNWGVLTLMTLTVIAASIIPEFLDDTLLIVLISFVINLVVSLGFTKATLSLVDGKKVSYVDLFTQVSVKNLIFVFIASAIVSILSFIGLLLLIIPGIIISLGLSQVVYVILDQDKGIIGSLKESWRITKGYRVKIVLVGLMAILLIFVGALAFGLGILIALPLTYLMYARMYRDLVTLAEVSQNSNESVSEDTKKDLE